MWEQLLRPQFGNTRSRNRVHRGRHPGDEGDSRVSFAQEAISGTFRQANILRQTGPKYDRIKYASGLKGSLEGSGARRPRFYRAERLGQGSLETLETRKQLGWNITKLSGAITRRSVILVTPDTASNELEIVFAILP